MVRSVLEAFTLPFVQRGLFEVALLAVAAGAIGTWIVLRGLAFYAHAVGTAAFPGLVLADGLGFSALLGAAGTGLLVALGVGYLARRERGAERTDAQTALVLVGALALGVILASDVFRSGSNVETLLFGSLLLVDRTDFVFTGAVSAAALLAGLLLGPRWLLTGFDPANARALGARSWVPDAVLLVLVALASVATLSTLGALLATALLVVPAATTRLLVDRMRPWQLATAALVLVEGVVGLWASVQLNAAPGAALAVLTGVVFLLVALVRAGLRRPGRRAVAGVAAAAVALLAAGCGSAGSGSSASPALDVVATTTQLGDFVREVGGDRVALTQVLQPNADPHDYEPRPQDVVRTARAKLVLVSGDDLDTWMDDVVDQSGSKAPSVDVSRGLPDVLPGQTSGAEASAHDPHWWHDPANAERAVMTIRDALGRADPAGRSVFTRNATVYLARLRILDAGIRRCMAAVPAAQRKLVTDHDAFGYFARRYGVRVIGAVIPSQTTEAQPSAGDLARLSDLIRREGVQAIFPESSINPKLARALAGQIGATSDHTLYGDTLGPAGSPGATYVTMERANADAMVAGFTGGSARCRIRGL